MIELAFDKEVSVPVDSIELKGNLIIPEKATGLVLFSHGSGSSRLSPRNNFVAKVLQEKGLATFLFDLLTYEEDQNYNTRFNISLLTQRLFQICNWIKENERTKDFPIGLFGSSTGAASALSVAAMMGDKIKSVVSRGGRPDLAFSYLEEVKASTLFIVGGNDQAVIELNDEAFAYLGAKKKNMAIVQGATHLFEEPGKLEEVAELAGNWFKEYVK
ncbi:MAG: dienelactone hydrolase family protein [Sporocytophaga sp.]|uniref:dienelactone hydrolase family protein n=1 Tax=Sporocytophaga sp. TaxID=2231183 RepID=UPI001B08C362|nr:dienelactone hydrolase family protein [Sporocytophaga sp.]MBO9703307.1 dienelactone hydrolase family protein [Sporocytophaga sp.]